MILPKNISFFFILLPLIASLAISSCGSGDGGGGINENIGDSNTLLHGKNISNTTTDSSKPAIAADSKGNVYVAWEEAATDSRKEIYIGSSGNSGVNFTTQKSITKESQSYCKNSTGSEQRDVNMAVGEDDSLYLTWIDSWPIYSVSDVKSFREGDTSCNIVSDTYRTASNAYSPHIGLRGSGNIHIVWAEDHGTQRDISYVHYKDASGTFLPSDGPKNLSASPSDDSSEPLLGFEGTFNVDTVWVEGPEGTRTVNFSRSADDGISFSTPQIISSPPLSDSHCPALATSGAGQIYVAYKGDNSIYFARWESNTSSFSDIGYLTPDSVSPSCPEIATSLSGIIYIVWSDNGKIWVASSTDATIFTTIIVSDPAATSSSPKIAIDGNYINVVWVQENKGAGDIYFSGSIDTGKIFSPPRNLSNSAGPSLNPVITADGSNYIYVAWTEGNAGERDIYFIRDNGARGLPNP